MRQARLNGTCAVRRKAAKQRLPFPFRLAAFTSKMQIGRISYLACAEDEI